MANSNKISPKTNPANLKKIKFEYIKPPLYNPMYVNGIIGGPSPKGDIIINFYTDITVVPTSQTHEITEAGTVGVEIIEKRLPKILSDGDTFTIHRNIQSGVIMNLNEAKGLYKWLGEQIEIVEKMPKIPAP